MLNIKCLVMIKIAIFASGFGTNASNIITYFKDNLDICVSGIYTDNPDAKVISLAIANNISFFLFSKEDLNNPAIVLDDLQKNGINFIILAGFLRLIPNFILKNFQNRIINIHPSLLPAYGGQGMFGDNVHRAVLANAEKQSGITIHYVSEKYDEGAIILQKTCLVFSTDTVNSLAKRVHTLEYDYYPTTIESLCNDLLSSLK